MANKHQQIAQAIHNINNAPQLEKEMREDLEDDNIIYNYFNRNKAIRIAISTIEGSAKGTCVAESTERFSKMLHTGNYKFLSLLRGHQTSSCGVNGIVFHQFITYALKNKKGWCLYYESYSNGLHKRVPIKYMLNKFITLEESYLYTPPGISKGRNNGYKAVFRPASIDELATDAYNIEQFGIAKSEEQAKRRRVVRKTRRR
jgi:hypothetical protein